MNQNRYLKNLINNVTVVSIGMQRSISCGEMYILQIRIPTDHVSIKKLSYFYKNDW